MADKEKKAVDVQAFKKRRLKAINMLTNDAKKRRASDRIQANK